MTATFAPSPWPAPAPAVRNASPWRFGREVSLQGPDGPMQGVRWVLKRNCSASPRQLLGVYVSLCVLSLAVATGFFLRGAPAVLAFAGLELFLVGVALLIYARHAGDRETLTLAGRALRVEQQRGPHTERADFRAEWLCVEPAHGQNSLVELSGSGRTVRVGRFLRPELRAAFAQELRRALRTVPDTPNDPILEPQR
jgi:uncharacterized membrane protein